MSQGSPTKRTTRKGRSAFSFPGSARLKDRFDFIRLQKSGEKLYSKHFLVSITESKTNCSRLGVAITKKVSPNATVRNKIKRRLREIFRLNRANFRGNFDVVIVARRDAHLCTYEEVEREVLGALRRGGYLTAI